MGDAAGPRKVSPSELAALREGILAGLLLSHTIKLMLDANGGNLDVRLQIRKFELVDRLECTAVGPIAVEDKPEVKD